MRRGDDIAKTTKLSARDTSSRKGQCEQSQEEPKSVRSSLKVPLRSSLFSPAVIKNTLTNNNVGEERGSSS